MHALKLLILGAVLSAIVAGCGDAAPAAVVPAPVAAKPKAVAKAVVDAGTADQPQYIYSYNPVGKRDPFRSYNEEVAPRDRGDDVSASCGEPLCQYDLDQLTLVAVVTGDANPVAMLQDPDGVGHIIRRNAKVGKQGGKITQILRDCIEVTEFFKTAEGKVNPNKLDICIKQEMVAKPAYDLLNNKNE